MLIEDKEIKELYDLKHNKDNYPKGFNYFDNILKKSLPPLLYKNPKLEIFLNKLEPMVAHFFDQMNIMKNWKNWYVDKYKNDHIK
jgi:hypothetical protein